MPADLTNHAAEKKHRLTENKALNRSPARKPVSPQAKGTAKKPDAKQVAQPTRDPEKEKLRNNRYADLGIVANSKYEFKESPKKSSWVEVGQDSARFLDAGGKRFLTLEFATMEEILVTTGDKLPDAPRKYKSSSDFRENLIKRYYAYFIHSDGNPAATNLAGSGQFRYEISKQHLADSVANELQHFFWKVDQKGLENLLAKFADEKHGMECYGTTILNVLKSRGLVPPSMLRVEFEMKYANVLQDLPEQNQHHLLIGGGGGAEETKRILEKLIAKLSLLDWGRFTGMDSKKASVRILENTKDIGKEVQKGYVVFVGVPGHYKAAVSGQGNDIKYDDPLGAIGHILYDDKTPLFGVVVE